MRDNLADRVLAETVKAQYLKTKLELIEAVEKDDLEHALTLIGFLIAVQGVGNV